MTLDNKKIVKEIPIKRVKDSVPQYHTYTTQNMSLAKYHKKYKIYNDNIEAFIDYLGVKIKHSRRMDAQYQINTDTVQMPFKFRFKRLAGVTREQNYYSTLFHEVGHWTGNKKRLNRKSLVKYERDFVRKKWGTRLEALEEVTVELTANMMMEFFDLQSKPSYVSLCFINKELGYLCDTLQPPLYEKATRQAKTAFNYIRKQYTQYVKEKRNR